MALDIIEVKLNRQQEETVLNAARKQGKVMLILSDKGGVRFSTNDLEELHDDEPDATTVNFSTEYYQELFVWLARCGIVPSEELTAEVEQIIRNEKDREDEEFSNSIIRIDAANEKAVTMLQAKLEDEMKTEISNKLKNDYRFVLKKLKNSDFKADYLAKWLTRTIGEKEGNEYADELQSVQDTYAINVLLSRMYGRIFIDDGMPVEPGRPLKWIRVLPEAAEPEKAVKKPAAKKAAGTAKKTKPAAKKSTGSAKKAKPAAKKVAKKTTKSTAKRSK